MQAVAHSPEFAKKTGIPQSVGKEFMVADKKFKSGALKEGINNPRTNRGAKQLPNASLKKYVGKKDGGIMKHSDMSKDKPMMKKIAGEAVKGHEKKMHSMAKGGVTRADGCVSKGHTKGKMIAMKSGGMC